MLPSTLWEVAEQAVFLPQRLWEAVGVGARVRPPLPWGTHNGRKCADAVSWGGVLGLGRRLSLVHAFAAAVDLA